MTTLLALLTVVVCGLGFRIRGGLWNTVIERHVHWGSTTARLVSWALPVTLCVAVWYTLPWYMLISMFVAVWAGCLLPWYGSIDMARIEGDWHTDAVNMTWRGALWCVPMSVVFVWTGLWMPAALCLASGALMAVWYEIGWRIPSKVPGFQAGPELGELIFGCVLGLALVLGAIL